MDTLQDSDVCIGMRVVCTAPNGHRQTYDCTGLGWTAQVVTVRDAFRGWNVRTVQIWVRDGVRFLFGGQS